MSFRSSSRLECVSKLGFFSKDRNWWACLLLVTFAGLALRLGGINVHSFWYDESVSANLAQATTWDLLSGRAKDNGNPPLYWIALKGTSAFMTPSETAFRWFSVLCGTLTIPLLATLGRRLLSPQAGMIAATLLAFSPFALELSTEARAYALCQLLAVLNTLVFVLWIENRNSRLACLYVGTLSLCCLTHYYALVIPVSQGISLLVLSKSDRRIGRWLIMVAFAAALTSFWLPAFLDQIGTTGNAIRMADSWNMQFLATPLAFGFGRTLVWRSAPPLVLAGASLAAVSLVWLFAAWGTSQALINDSISKKTAFNGRFSAVLLSSCVLIPILLPFLLAITVTPIYTIRYATVGLPAFLLLAGFGMTLMRHHWRPVVCGALTLLTAVSLFKFFNEPLRDAWRTATPAILAGLREDDLVLFDSDIEVLPFLFYSDLSAQPPPQLIGLVSGIREEGRMLGVRYVNGERVDDDPLDYTARILQANRLRLATCVPTSSPDDYFRFFSRFGFSVTRDMHCHRIDVFQLDHNPPPLPEYSLETVAQTGTH